MNLLSQVNNSRMNEFIINYYQNKNNSFNAVIWRQLFVHKDIFLKKREAEKKHNRIIMYNRLSFNEKLNASHLILTEFLEFSSKSIINLFKNFIFCVLNFRQKGEYLCNGKNYNFYFCSSWSLVAPKKNYLKLENVFRVLFKEQH